MSGQIYTTPSLSIGQISFTGGLNTTASQLALQDNESPDLQNIDFDIFGSIIKRNGYAKLNGTAIATSPTIDGLHWFEFTSGTGITRMAIAVAGGKLWKMDDLDGTWDDITNGLTITAGNHGYFSNFLNEVYITNGYNLPIKYDGATASAMTVPTGLTIAKFNALFNNYLFLANCTVSGVTHKSRIYWSTIKNTGTWNAADFIEVAMDDGQAITGLWALGDRLVIFKERSIYILTFTGDADIPFILPSGGKTNSSVGCAASSSIQEIENGLVFVAADGLYYFDGFNSYKISDKITTTFLTFNQTRLNQISSLVYKKKNVYMASVPLGSDITNSLILVWNYALKAFSQYTGIAAASMSVFYVNGNDERLYFGDYAGFVYRMDTGANDNPLGVETAIDAYYWTNWKAFRDLIVLKSVPECVVYHTLENATLDFAYAFDLEETEQYSHTINMATSSDVYGTGLYGTATYAGIGSALKRIDLTGRGRVIRFKFANDRVDETFRIDGLGMYPHGETNV
jgi:hypothetical protein